MKQQITGEQMIEHITLECREAVRSNRDLKYSFPFRPLGYRRTGPTSDASDNGYEAEIVLSRFRAPSQFLSAAVRLVVNFLALENGDKEEPYSKEQVEYMADVLRQNPGVHVVSTPGGMMMLDRNTKVQGTGPDVLRAHAKEIGWPSDEPERFGLVLAAARKYPEEFDEWLFAAKQDWELDVARRAIAAPFPPRSTAQNAEVRWMSSTWWGAILEDASPIAIGYLCQMFNENSLLDGFDEPFHKYLKKHLSLSQFDQLENMITQTSAVLAHDDLNNFCWKWRDSAFARVDVGHKLAAALMLTDAPDDVNSPWDAFSVVVQPGLADPIRRVWAQNIDGYCRAFWAIDESGNDWLLDPVPVPVFSDESSPSDQFLLNEERVQLLQNLVRGVCLTVTDKEECRVSKKNASAPKIDRSVSGPPPVGELYRVAPPLELDLREKVAEIWTGKTREGGKPKVQFKVRGFWRDQACGPRHSLRKRMWIPPFWKGPKEARVLLRKLDIE